MHDDDHELVNQLFAVATAMLEDATEIAAAGQVSGSAATLLAVHGRQLQTAVRDVAAIAEAITIIANLGRIPGPNPRNIPG